MKNRVHPKFIPDGSRFGWFDLFRELMVELLSAATSLKAPCLPLPTSSMTMNPYRKSAESVLVRRCSRRWSFF